MNSRVNQEHWREVLSQLLAGSRSYAPRIAVLAAHPDDETIGASVLLAHSEDPAVIYLTDGAPRDKKLRQQNTHEAREEYASVRRSEALRALSCGGIAEQQIHWLGGVDQEAVFQASELAARLAKLLTQERRDLLITHPYEGGHPDHDAAALIARLALAKLDQEDAPILVEMTSYHARESRCVTGEFLKETPAEELRLELTADDRERKRNMFAAYASQRQVLSAFDTSQERWRKASNYDFSLAPHEGKLWYESMDWMTGEKWRAIAAESISAIQVQPCR